jgi:hypothetical protein
MVSRSVSTGRQDLGSKPDAGRSHQRPSVLVTYALVSDRDRVGWRLSPVRTSWLGSWVRCGLSAARHRVGILIFEQDPGGMCASVRRAQTAQRRPHLGARSGPTPTRGDCSVCGCRRRHDSRERQHLVSHCYSLAMGIRNYLIEGVSVTGKTSVCKELQRRPRH